MQHAHHSTTSAPTNSKNTAVTPKARKDLQRNLNTRDTRDDSRWKDDYAQPRSQVALFDLANAQKRVSREVLELLKADEIEEATTAAKLPSPLEAMNDILAVSSLSIRLSINDDGDILAGHDGNTSFGITQLSDGERNAVMLAAQVLTAEPETLFLVDEPERHLHRAITEPTLPDHVDTGDVRFSDRYETATQGCVEFPQLPVRRRL